MHVRDLMRSGDAVPAVGPEASFSELMHEMTRKGLGAAAVVDGTQLLGIFTDGDLRRLIETGADLRALKAHEVMHASPRRVRADALAVDAAALMELHRVNCLLVVEDDDTLVGAINTNDLLRAKVI